MIPGQGVAFVSYEGKGQWAVSWERKPDGLAGHGTQEEVRQFLLEAAPGRVVVWDSGHNDYVDLDPNAPHWPQARNYFDRREETGPPIS